MFKYNYWEFRLLPNLHHHILHWDDTLLYTVFYLCT